jgi:predicted N-formylglutamate amidohydrolase
VSREFDAGVLFDDYDGLADSFARCLREAGLSVRLNEPYSGLDGLIFSARHHGRRNAIPYLELEVNNRLLRTPEDIRSVADHLAAPLEKLLRALGRT